jgi:hypothetical protein
VIVPITEGKTGSLVLNFYPVKKKDQPIELLKADDARFFEVI